MNKFNRKYQCTRCGYETKYSSEFTSHISRQTPCGVFDEGAIFKQWFETFKQKLKQDDTKEALRIYNKKLFPIFRNLPDDLKKEFDTIWKDGVLQAVQEMTSESTD